MFYFIVGAVCLIAGLILAIMGENGNDLSIMGLLFIIIGELNSHKRMIVEMVYVDNSVGDDGDEQKTSEEKTQ